MRNEEPSSGNGLSFIHISFFKKRGFMDKKGFKGATWKCVTLPHSLQPDATSCGVFVCKVSSCKLFL